MAYRSGGGDPTKSGDLGDLDTLGPRHQIPNPWEGAMSALLFVALFAQPADRGVRLTPPDFELPPTKSWVLVAAGAPGPGKQGYRPAASVDDLKQELLPEQP